MRAMFVAVCLVVGFGAAQAASWPQCSVRSGTAGAPAIVVDGAVHSPLIFVGNNQFGKDDVLLQEIRQASEAGIKIFGFNVPMDWSGAQEPTDAVVEKFCSAAPEAYFYIRVWLGAPEAWCREHPDECVVQETESAEGSLSYSRKAHVSPASLVWRGMARERLTGCLRRIVEGPHGARFLGVCLTYLQTGEWFNFDANEFMDYSPANLAGFRRWLKTRYKSDKELRAAWGQEEVSRDTAELPRPLAREASTFGPFRDPVKQRAAADMERYQSEIVAETIGYFASAAKEATAGRSLVGAFYGYTMELSNNGPRALANSGHLALSKLLACKDLDLVHAPVSYFERELGQPSHLHFPVDSVALHGKLAILEEDTFTHLVQTAPSDPTIPGWNERTGSLEETLSVTRRHFANAFMHGSGMWFFDLLSDGRWADNGFWQSMPLFRRVAAELRERPVFEPEVAVALSEEAVHSMRTTTYPVLLQSMSWWRSEIDRIGAPVGYYLQRDLPRLPQSVKVLILANAFTMSKEERAAVEALQRRGGTVIWNYAPGIQNEKGLGVGNIGKLTGIEVEAKFDAVPMSIVSALTEESVEMDGQSWQPRFVVTAREGDVIARYIETNEVSAMACKAGPGVSVYTATPRLPVGVLREVCNRAGVHLYRDTPGMTAVVGQYLFVHTENAGKVEFRWPGPVRSVERIVPRKSYPMSLDEGGVWHDTLPEKTTAVYYCESGEAVSGSRLRQR